MSRCQALPTIPSCAPRLLQAAKDRRDPRTPDFSLGLGTGQRRTEGSELRCGLLSFCLCPDG